MKTEALERYLNSFGKQVVNRAKGNLQKAKGGKTNLEKSLSFKVITSAEGFSVQFYMDSYGTFVDKGVSGTKTKRSYTNLQGKQESTPYSYTSKGPPIDILSKWIKKKGIKPKGTGRGRSKKTGQFVSGLAYLISKKIKRDGIKSLSFFSKPLGIKYDNLKEDFLKQFTNDVTTYITTFTK